MTIKLSTTNSVNKTLQHKALWDLETPFWDTIGDSRGCSTEGISAPQMQEQALDSSERSTGICISSGGVHPGEWRTLSAEFCKQTLNLKVQKDITSYCEQEPGQLSAVQAYFVKCGGWLNDLRRSVH